MLRPRLLVLQLSLGGETGLAQRLRQAGWKLEKKEKEEEKKKTRKKAKMARLRS